MGEQLGQTGAGSGNFQMTGGWQRQIGSSGLLDYSSAGETFDLHKASAVGGSCGTSDHGVCDKHGSLVGTAPGMPMTVTDFKVDTVTGQPLRVELTGRWDPFPEEHLAVTCTGDCSPDASGTSNVTTAASILTGMYNLNSDPFQIVLAGWTKENGNWVLHQYWSHNETESPPGFGYSRESAVVTWALTSMP